MGLDASVYCDCFERGRLRTPPRPEWDYQDFNFDTDPPKMVANAAKIKAMNPDLRPLKQRGGKILHYQGMPIWLQGHSQYLRYCAFSTGD